MSTQTQARSARVFLLHNIIAPYRLPVFEALAHEWNLTVHFCQATTSDRRWQISLADYTFDHTVLPHWTIRAANMASLVVNPTLLGFLFRHHYDAYIVGENPQNMLSLLTVLWITKIKHKPLICWSEHIEGERDFATSGTLGNKVIEAYRRIIYRHTKSFIAYGTRATEFLIRRGVPREKIVTGIQVVPQNQTPPVEITKKQMGFEGKKVILTINYLIPRKGLDLLIQAFKSIERDDTVLVIAGSGEQEAHLKQLAENSPNILFPGYVDGVLKAQYYTVADLFVLPTLHDPWGLVVNEAMAYGLPIVVTENAGCAPDLVVDNGVVIPAHDVEALQAALERLLNDDALRLEMGNRSRQIIQHYNVTYAQQIFSTAINRALNL